MPKIRIRDIDIHYQITDFTDPWRQPETVLLHHGFARNLRFWYRWVPQLCRHYRVLTLDARGCGETTVPPPEHNFSVEEMAEDALGLLDGLGIERVHWGAEASGGIVGINAALAQPRRIATLTLCNTPMQLPKATNELFVPGEVLAHGTGHWARKSINNRIDVDKVSPEWLEWSIREHDRTRPEVAVVLHGVLEPKNLEPILPRIEAPTLVIASDRSKIAPRSEMERMIRLLPRGKLVILENHGQGVAWMAPERCATEMKQFIEAQQQLGSR